MGDSTPSVLLQNHPAKHTRSDQQHPEADAQPRTLTAASLFAGAGGMDLGFMAAGFDLVFAAEIDADACKTHTLNLRRPILHADVKDLAFNRDLEDVGVLFGGPPCQGFSVNGKMDPDDERSALIHTFFNIVDRLRPKAFVCENVSALATLQRWREVRETLLARAGEDYEVVLLLLNAADFGVPQNRHRMFLTGIRRDLFQYLDDGLGQRMGAMLAQHRHSAPTVGDIIRGLGRAGSASNARTCSAKVTYLKKPVLRASSHAGMLFNGGGRPVRIDGVANTLPASMGGNRTPIVDEDEVFDGKSSFVDEYHRHLLAGGKPRSGRVPERLRRLTIDECQAIQGFPSCYQFVGTKSSIYKQIGNAVPPSLAFAVASSVHQVLQDCLAAWHLGWQDAA